MQIYIGNLSPGVTRNDLEWILGDAASVVFVEAPDRAVSPRGYAFAEVHDSSSLNALVTGLNGAYLKGERLIVRPVIDRARQARVLRARGWRPRPAQLLSPEE